MKSLTLSFSMVILLFFGLLSPTTLPVARAAMADLPKPDIPCNLQVGCDDLRPLLDEIASWLVYLAGTLFIFMFLWGALQYLTGAGNRDQIGKAKQTMLAAGIGLLITIASYAIIILVIDRLTG